MRTRAVIHLDRFNENLESVKTRIGSRLICVPVKSNAYGHGAVQIAKTSLKAGAHCLGIAAVSEGIELRKAGITVPILLFSQPSPDEIQDIVKANLTPFISDTEFAELLNSGAKAAKTKLSVHIKIDTGMKRIGCAPGNALALARQITKCSNLKLTGTATHLAVSDSAKIPDINFTKKQLSRFKKAVNDIQKAGINPGIVHAANSGAVILHPDTWLDMVRPGILLYGYKAAQEFEAPVKQLKKLRKYKAITAEPVMELIAEVSLIKKIKKGESVSYGRTWIAKEDTNIAVLSIGYGDGLARLASNSWQAVIGGEAYPFAGRICMDQCCVDLGKKTKVKRWDEAVIFGGSAPSAAELAKAAATIPYEITCGINKRVPRVYKQ